MPFSIVLFFDTQSDLAVQKLGLSLEKEKVPAIFSTLGATPHVSLAVFEQYDPQRLHSVMKKIAASFPPLSFRLSSLGTFPGKEGVLFLAPAAAPGLLEIHSWLHRALSKAIEGSWVYYFPGGWVPHCTLSIGLTAKKLAQGISLLRKNNFSVKGYFNHLALIETQPVRIKPIRLIYCVPFTGKKIRGNP